MSLPSFSYFRPPGSVLWETAAENLGGFLPELLADFIANWIVGRGLRGR
jgi:hypothetical protein